MNGGSQSGVDGDDGRIETRQRTLCYDVDWLLSDRRCPGEPAFPGLAMIDLVASETERDGKIEHERRYYLSSARPDAETFARAARGHWGVESRLHWVLDVAFHDDLARLRTGYGPQNMGVIKHAARNFPSQAKPTISLKNRRKHAGWNPDSLAAVIRGDG
ncbi:MAG: ISAs1 family transposase [Acetobacteraceae bacterium]